MLFNRASYCPMNNQPCCIAACELAIDVLSRVSPRSCCRVHDLDLNSVLLSCQKWATYAVTLTIEWPFGQVNFPCCRRDPVYMWL